MRKLVIKPLGHIAVKSRHFCWKQWHLKKLLNKLENWAETLGDWYGAIFPQEHPGQNITLVPVVARNYRLHSYHHGPDKYNSLLKKRKACI